MSIDLVGMAMIVWGMIAFTRGGQVMVNALVISCLFGATAALALPAAGGVGVAPVYVMLGFLLVLIVLSRRLPDLLLVPARVPGGLCLAALVAWGALSAVFVPHLLAGEATISSVDRVTAGVQSAGFELLRPVSGNLTQTGYAIAALIGFSALVVLLSSEAGYARFQRAMIILAGLTVISAVLDLLGFYVLGLDILSVLKTADYTLFNETELAGMKRISGTFSEASAFASFSLALFAFSFELYLKGIHKKLMRVISAALLVFLLLSTSTTAYAALLMYTSIQLLHALFLVFAKAEVKRFSIVGGGLFALALVIFILVVVSPVVHDRVEELFYTVILTKGESQSGIERALLNTNAWQAFLDTHGVGVGLGSSRASSYPLVLLSNLGIPGAIFYVMWLIRTLGAKTSLNLPAGVLATVSASRWAILASLITASLSAAVFDVGLLFYFFCAASVAHVMLNVPERTAQRVNHVFTSA